MTSYKHDHTHLTSPEPDKVIQFYTQVMGATYIKEQEAWGSKLVDLDLGGVLIRISNVTGADNAWKGPRFGLHHLGLEVGNMDEAVAELKASGAEFIVESFLTQTGIRAAFVTGPDNVLFEIVEKRES